MQSVVRKLLCHRRYGKQIVRHLTSNKFQEVTIPVPWGYVAGKWWGTRDKQPILAVHGVQDNAATFDTLIPLLDIGETPVFAVDFPGHGRSTGLSPGFPPHYTDAVVFLRWVCKRMFKGWGNVTFLAHSFGSSACFVYSAIYPDEVDKFISLECSRLRMSGNTVENIRKTIDKVIEYSMRTLEEPPSRTYDEQLQRMYKGRKERLTLESCRTLLTRGLVESRTKGKFYYSRDVTVKLPALGQFSLDFWSSLASHIKAPTLAIEGDQGLYAKKGPLRDVFLKQLEMLKKNTTDFEHVILAGGHHVHLDDPQKVAPIINKFLREAPKQKAHHVTQKLPQL